MAAANASARGQRVAIMASPLHQLIGFHLTVDCRSAGCRGERSLSITELSASYRDSTVGEVLGSMRCTRGGGGRVLAAAPGAVVAARGQGVAPVGPTPHRNNWGRRPQALTAR